MLTIQVHGTQRGRAGTLADTAETGAKCMCAAQRLRVRPRAHHEAEAAAGRVLEGDAPGVVAQQALDVPPRVQLHIKPGRHLYLAVRVAILQRGRQL